VLVYYFLGVYETQSNPQANRVIALSLSRFMHQWPVCEGRPAMREGVVAGHLGVPCGLKEGNEALELVHSLPVIALDAGGQGTVHSPCEGFLASEPSWTINRDKLTCITLPRGRFAGLDQPRPGDERGLVVCRGGLVDDRHQPQCRGQAGAPGHALQRRPPGLPPAL
jgi:hypothetical protein